MKLLTVDLKKNFAKFGPQQDEKDPLIIARYFLTFSNWTFYAVLFDHEAEIFTGIFIFEAMEWGTISLHDLESIRSLGGRVKVERDTFFKPTRMSEIDELSSMLPQ